MSSSEQLTVLFEGTFDAPQKSADNCLENVALLGPVSKNGYRYECFTKENADLYQGASAFLNHGKGPDGRTVREWVGTIENATPRPEEKRFRGRLVFLDAVKDDPDVKKVREAAEKGLKNVGMSHVVSIDETKHKRTTKEGTVITGLKKVHSVDIVMNPATTSGLYESETMSKTKTAKEILLGICRFDRERKLVEALGEMADVEVVVKEDADAEHQLDYAISSIGAKVWHDDAKRAEVLKVRKALIEGVVGEVAPPVPPPAPGSILTYQEAHKLCDEQKVTASATLLESLTGLEPLKAKVIVEQFVTKDKEIGRLTRLNEEYAKAAGKTKAPGTTVSQGVSVPTVVAENTGDGDTRPSGNTPEDAKKRAELRRKELQGIQN